jgi:hypothetical protein
MMVVVMMMMMMVIVDCYWFMNSRMRWDDFELRWRTFKYDAILSLQLHCTVVNSGCNTASL